MQAPWSYTPLLDGLTRRDEADAVLPVQNGALVALSGAELARRVRAVASGLVRIGLKQGEVVLLMGPNASGSYRATVGLKYPRLQACDAWYRRKLRVCAQYYLDSWRVRQRCHR